MQVLQVVCIVPSLYLTVSLCFYSELCVCVCICMPLQIQTSKPANHYHKQYCQLMPSGLFFADCTYVPNDAIVAS